MYKYKNYFRITTPTEKDVMHTANSTYSKMHPLHLFSIRDAFSLHRKIWWRDSGKIADNVIMCTETRAGFTCLTVAEVLVKEKLSLHHVLHLVTRWKEIWVKMKSNCSYTTLHLTVHHTNHNIVKVGVIVPLMASCQSELPMLLVTLVGPPVHSYTIHSSSSVIILLWQGYNLSVFKLKPSERRYIYRIFIYCFCANTSWQLLLCHLSSASLLVPSIIFSWHIKI